jgi:hypothetical protein
VLSVLSCVLSCVSVLSVFDAGSVGVSLCYSPFSRRCCGRQRTLLSERWDQVQQVPREFYTKEEPVFQEPDSPESVRQNPVATDRAPSLEATPVLPIARGGADGAPSPDGVVEVV